MGIFHREGNIHLIFYWIITNISKDYSFEISNCLLFTKIACKKEMFQWNYIVNQSQGLGCLWNEYTSIKNTLKAND